MKIWILILFLIISACNVTNNTGVEVEVKARCVSINGNESTFESENPNYGEIIISGHSRSYKVGEYYVLVLRKK